MNIQTLALLWLLLSGFPIFAQASVNTASTGDVKPSTSGKTSGRTSAPPARPKPPARIAPQTQHRNSALPAIVGEHAMDVLGGASNSGRWAVRLQGGYPWQSLRVQRGFGVLTGFVEVDSALFRRTQPSLGISMRWVDKPAFRLSGEFLFGWQVQSGDVAQQGPSFAFRLKLLWRFARRFGLYARFDTRHTLLFNQFVVDKASEVTSRMEVEHRWSPWGEVGLAFALNDWISLDLGLVYPWIDAPSVSIPGFHLGLQLAW